MAYKYNPFLSGLDNTVDASAFTILGTEPNLAAIQAKPTPSSGDVWQAADTGIFYVYDATAAAWESLGTLAGPAGPAGATGATGADGADGADGQTILNGNGAPVDNVTGTDGDFYIDTSAHAIYGPRTAGAWGSPTSLVAGGATTLGGLTDVDLTTSPPTNGEALVYDSVNSEWVPGSAGATAAGSANQIQYNDGAGGLAASADLTWDNTAKELGVTGDLNLDDGGSFSTTVQSVTPTANRTISFPDATGTVALVSGANGTIQYNDAGTLKGNSDFTVDLDWNDASTAFTGLKLNVTDGAGGSPAGNSDSKLLDLQVGGTSQFRLNNEGAITSPNDLIFTRGATTSFRSGSTRFSITSELGLSNNNASSPDIFIARDAANTLAQRNDTAAQTYRLYNTWGNNGVDFERTSLTRDSSGLVIDAQKGGTGVDPTNLLDLKLDGTSVTSISASGDLQLRNPGSAASGGTIEPKFGTGNRKLVFTSYAEPFDFVPFRAGQTSPKFSIGWSIRQGVNISSDMPVNWVDSINSNTGNVDLSLARDSAGVLKITDGSTGTGYLRQEPIPVGDLPTAAAGNAGTRIFVSDASVAAAGNFGSVVAGGGSNTVPVYSDGGAWRIG